MAKIVAAPKARTTESATLKRSKPAKAAVAEQIKRLIGEILPTTEPAKARPMAIKPLIQASTSMPETAVVIVVRMSGNHWLVTSSIEAVRSMANIKTRNIGRRASLNIAE